MKLKAIILSVVFVLLVSFAAAQEKGSTEEAKEKKVTPDYSADHKSIDSIINATYGVISGPKGQKRDWDRFRALFHADARLIPSGKGRNGEIGASASTPDGYIGRSEPFLMQNGFYEQEIARRSEIFGNIAHVFSTYEARFALEDKNPFLRGINSFQLFYDGKRWWIMTIYWLAESPENPLPEKYLKKID
ncbi:MAG: hypothetical protein OEM82_04920 [Acidobacteriota bacterium]|nr:hypothetical protein [Acidobacteriota bacterium]MDH3531020.1 hypothetical protein [Acidobacteriota bacterium]